VLCRTRCLGVFIATPCGRGRRAAARGAGRGPAGVHVYVDPVLIVLPSGTTLEPDVRSITAGRRCGLRLPSCPRAPRPRPVVVPHLLCLGLELCGGCVSIFTRRIRLRVPVSLSYLTRRPRPLSDRIAHVTHPLMGRVISVEGLSSSWSVRSFIRRAAAGSPPRTAETGPRSGQVGRPTRYAFCLAVAVGLTHGGLAPHTLSRRLLGRRHPPRRGYRAPSARSAAGGEEVASRAAALASRTPATTWAMVRRPVRGHVQRADRRPWDPGPKPRGPPEASTRARRTWCRLERAASVHPPAARARA